MGKSDYKTCWCRRYFWGGVCKNLFLLSRSFSLEPFWHMTHFFFHNSKAEIDRWMCNRVHFSIFLCSSKSPLKYDAYFLQLWLILTRSITYIFSSIFDAELLNHCTRTACMQPSWISLFFSLFWQFDIFNPLVFLLTFEKKK